jgi:cytochrome c nitrite reductase small subunit
MTAGTPSKSVRTLIRRSRRPLGIIGISFAIFLGSTMGLGLFTFQYGQGLSYLSHDPTACKNCHIMNDQFDSWTKAGHHQAAVCVDCHLPPEGIQKWIAKSENGFWHSKGFTLNDFHEPIMIKRRNPQILQENCLRCHGDFVHDLVAGSTSADDAVSCVHCHRNVGHGARFDSATEIQRPTIPRVAPDSQNLASARLSEWISNDSN